MRLFIALDIDEAIRLRLGQFVNEVRHAAPGVRFVGPETFHVTLKFLGESNQLDAIRGALRGVRATPFELSFCGTGFFPNPHAPRVFWVGIHAGPELERLAQQIGEKVAPIGFPPEPGPYRPHLTLARAGSGNPRMRSHDRPNSKFQQLQQRLASMQAPDFGTMTAREFFLYESRLSPKGASYIRLERYALEP